MKQKNLENIEWDNENPISNSNITIDAWVKLNIGDILIGIYIDKYTDPKYDNLKYIFQNATIIDSKKGTKETYNKIGINDSGNLKFTLDNNELLGTPLKIIREQDIPLEGRPKPAHHFKIIQPKKQSS